MFSLCDIGPSRERYKLACFLLPSGAESRNLTCEQRILPRILRLSHENYKDKGRTAPFLNELVDGSLEQLFAPNFESIDFLFGPVTMIRIN